MGYNEKHLLAIMLPPGLPPTPAAVFQGPWRDRPRFGTSLQSSSDCRLRRQFQERQERWGLAELPGENFSQVSGTRSLKASSSKRGTARSCRHPLSESRCFCPVISALTFLFLPEKTDPFRYRSSGSSCLLYFLNLFKISLSAIRATTAKFGKCFGDRRARR